MLSNSETFKDYLGAIAIGFLFAIPFIVEIFK